MVIHPSVVNQESGSMVVSRQLVNELTQRLMTMPNAIVKPIGEHLLSVIQSRVISYEEQVLNLTNSTQTRFKVNARKKMLHWIEHILWNTALKSTLWTRKWVLFDSLVSNTKLITIYSFLQSSQIRQRLADIYETEEQWREAARTLVGIPLETGQRYAIFSWINSYIV